MNTQKGFSNLLGFLLIVIVLGGGVYFYKSFSYQKEKANQENKAEVIATTTQQSNIVVNKNKTSGSDLTDAQIELATLSYLKIQKIGNEYIYSDGSGAAKFNGQTISRGDINNDGLIDAVVITRICGAGCFGYSNILLAINEKGSVKVMSPNISDTIPLSFQGKRDFQSVNVIKGEVEIVYTDGSSTEVKKYKLQGSNLVEN